MRLKVLAPALAALLLAACVGGGSLTPVAAVGSTSVSDAAQAAAMISAYRASRGLGPVRVDKTLNAAALQQARAVAAAGTLAHGDFASRMSSYGVGGGAAENLSAGTNSVPEVISQWQNSPGHNQNLLLPRVSRIGLARADSATRHGRYWALVLAR